MQFLLRFLIIALVSFAGELLNYLIPLSVPGSIYGFIIMFILLLTKVIKLDYIKPVSDFLLNVMPVTFIAPGVALITVLSELESILLPLLITVTLSTAVVMGVVGIVVEKIVKRGDR
ncbi:MAG: CidA/LrgA family protein [Clostridia bacterium]|nr:CidA/LrgA family protein [Clostridia bacterium]